jgi:ubiquinone/menaquinone biosynthesis C-methylase UbiE
MEHIDKGQVSNTAAEVYDEFFVPALFQDWTAIVLDAASVTSGQRVLDVACGTGVLARAAAYRVGDSGSVVGLDINDGMLAVARRNAPNIDWRQGQAEDILFDDQSFDAVVSQFGLMFFDNRAAALAEMMRVLRPDGKMSVAVWDKLENTPGYAAMVTLLERLFGEEYANGIRAPYNLGDTKKLEQILADADIGQFEITTHRGTVRFPSLEGWLYTDIKGWVLADMLNDDQFDLLQSEAPKALGEFVNDDGSVSFSSPAHVITATKVS